MFRWTNRQEYIKRTALLIFSDFAKTAEWCADNPGTTPAANWRIMDNLISKYSRNAEWMPRRSSRKARADICLEAFELARIYKNQQAQEYFWEQYRGAN